MRNPEELENERNQQIRIQCIDYATRIVGKPTYTTEKAGEITKHQDDVVEVATRIYEFVNKED